MVMDALAEKIGADISEKKHKALCGKGVIGGEKVILMKPQTYMNSSGGRDVYKRQVYHRGHRNNIHQIQRD